jgi:4-hydroxybenzoate polyprenyltransferase
MAKPKRSTIIPILLAIYLAVMAYIGWPAYASGQTSALQYFGTIAATLLILVLLHFTLKKRENKRNQ